MKINLRKNASSASMAAAEKTLRDHVEREGGRAYLLLGGNVVWGCERCGDDVVWAGGSGENDVNRMLAGMTY